MIIIIARIIEAWRDAQIFKNPIKDRGFWWHALKYPQYGAWSAATLIYFIGFYFWPGYESTIWLALGRTAVVYVADVLIAWPVFEYLLKRFRGGKQDNRESVDGVEW